LISPPAPEMQGPYGLCINKLFVLPGTPLAEQMVRAGKEIGDGDREELFGYYCRLFSIASLSKYSAPVVGLLRRVGVLRRRPDFIPMGAMELGFRVVNAVDRRVRRRRVEVAVAETVPPDLVQIQ